MTTSVSLHKDYHNSMLGSDYYNKLWNKGLIQISDNKIRPLSEETLIHLEILCEVSDGYLPYQLLAAKICYLKDLQNKFDNGTIDLGFKDRARAIAKCIGVALLVSSLFWLTAANSFANFFSAVGLGIVSGLNTTKIFKSFARTLEVFQRPTPKQLKAHINQINHVKISDQDKLQMQGVEKKISDKLEFLKKIKKDASALTEPQEKALANLTKILEKDLVDVGQLREAIDNRTYIL